MKDVIAVVAASTPHRGIGYQGQLPWKLPSDMAHFKRLTLTTPPVTGLENAVVMGRRTWESIPPSFRPLPGRLNVVLSQSRTAEMLNLPTNVVCASSLSKALMQLEEMEQVGTIFIIGGAQVYQQALAAHMIDKIVYTQVKTAAGTKFDAFFPELDQDQWQEENQENSAWQLDAKVGLEYRIVTMTRTPRDETKEEANGGGATATAERLLATPVPTSLPPTTADAAGCIVVNPQEEQYLDLCRTILATGVPRGDRTGTGTLSIFGAQMRFDLRNNVLPLLTTKRTFWRGVAEELLWFISGKTNANDLVAKDIHIWDGNGSREFLDERGLNHREVGDLGPVYGFQWRHFGAKYVDMHHDYTDKGVDQLADCIDKIINHPEDRRIIMSAWNPADLELMALPPCHMFCQFYVDTEKNELSCQMYQRSADMGLGVPFNIASYALLTHLMAHVTGRKAGDFVHTIGDAHIYLNHVEALQTQLTREPRAFPTLTINPAKKNIDDFVYEDLEVVGYNPHKTIKMKMAV